MKDIIAPKCARSFITHGVTQMAAYRRPTEISTYIAYFLLVFYTIAFLLKSHPALSLEVVDTQDSNITIAAVGDLLFHTPLQDQAYTHIAGFRSLWWRIDDLLRGADITYGNLEGPLSAGTVRNSSGLPIWKRQNRFTGYPLFNSHRMATLSIAQSGFDILSFSNNHTFDRGLRGAVETVRSVEEAGIAVVGFRSPHEDSPGRDWDEPPYTVTSAKDRRIAWIACTYGANVPIPEPKRIDLCFDDSDRLLAATTRLSQRDDIDAVIVVPHWGAEYRHQPSSRQRMLGQQFIEAGAIAVIGAHSHVLGPIERHCSPIGHCGTIAYSLGNFVSNQSGVEKLTSVVLVLELGFDRYGANIQNVGAIPITVVRRADREDRLTVEALQRNRTDLIASRELVERVIGERLIIDAYLPFF